MELKRARTEHEAAYDVSQSFCPSKGLVVPLSPLNVNNTVKAGNELGPRVTIERGHTWRLV